MDLASHHWSIWVDLKSGRRRSGAEISAGSVEAAGRFRDVSYCSVDLPTMETARFSKSFSTVPHHHYPRRVLTYRAFSHAWRLINQSEYSFLPVSLSGVPVLRMPSNQDSGIDMAY